MEELIHLLICSLTFSLEAPPILLMLYMLALGSIFRKYNISLYCFADDIQIYNMCKGLRQRKML